MKYHCNKCDKEFEKRHAYIAHCRIHSGYVRPLKTNSKTFNKKNNIHKTICPYCNRNFENGRILGGHMTHCILNPKYNEIKENMIISNHNRNFTWSDEDKKRISESRIKYLNEHPDKVPYKLNHSSKMSYPEKIFKNALENENISGWIYNYQNGIYSYDFAFPDLKIDVEIDGNTHLQENVIKIDERRDKFSKENGWIVIRFSAKMIKENLLECIKLLKTQIYGNN